MPKPKNKPTPKSSKSTKAKDQSPVVRNREAAPSPTQLRAPSRRESTENGGNSASATLFEVEGKMSTFGGPMDFGVTPSEGLALFDRGDLQDPAHRSLFLPAQPPGTTGMARRLNPDRFYLACRWDYQVTSRQFLRNCVAIVTNPQNGRSVEARPADWGPNTSTRRVADLSPGLAAELGLDTDDVCKIRIERVDEDRGEIRIQLGEARGPVGRGHEEGHGTRNPQPQGIIRTRRSPYHSSRNGAKINAIILHYTTGSTTEGTLSWFENNPRSVSAHYVIGRDGRIYQMVDDSERANHCMGANLHSIGIEHVATAGQRLSPAQEDASIELIRWLHVQYEVDPKRIQGHRYADEYTGDGTDCPHSLFGDRTEAAIEHWVRENIGE